MADQLDVVTDDEAYRTETRLLLNQARRAACYVTHWQDSDAIHEWTFLIDDLDTPEERLREAEHAFNASFPGRPFHRIAEIYLTRVEREIERLNGQAVHNTTQMSVFEAVPGFSPENNVVVILPQRPRPSQFEVEPDRYAAD